MSTQVFGRRSSGEFEEFSEGPPQKYNQVVYEFWCWKMAKKAAGQPNIYDEEKRIHGLTPRRSAFIQHGFTVAFPGS